MYKPGVFDIHTVVAVAGSGAAKGCQEYYAHVHKSTVSVLTLNFILFITIEQHLTPFTGSRNGKFSVFCVRPSPPLPNYVSPRITLSLP